MPLEQSKIHTERFISYRKYILQITQPSQYRCTQLQYRFTVISEAPSTLSHSKSKLQSRSNYTIEKYILQRIVWGLRYTKLSPRSSLVRQIRRKHSLAATEPTKENVHLSNGNLEKGAYVRSELCYLICLRHLFRSRAVTNLIFSFRK